MNRRNLRSLSTFYRLNSSLADGAHAMALRKRGVRHGTPSCKREPKWMNLSIARSASERYTCHKRVATSPTTSIASALESGLREIYASDTPCPEVLPETTCRTCKICYGPNLILESTDCHLKLSRVQRSCTRWSRWDKVPPTQNSPNPLTSFSTVKLHLNPALVLEPQASHHD